MRGKDDGMAERSVPVIIFVQRTIQFFCLACLVFVALGSLGLTLASAIGWIGWLDLEVGFGATVFTNAGMAVQIALTALLIGFCFFLPAHGRMIRLELAHRDFSMSMNDVARAYYASHAADRAGAFTLSSEFDSVRERILHLREHPDLGALEHEVLELAAQMSHQARDLAEVYSDASVDRAKLFLKQRMQEVDATRTRIEQALGTCREVRRFLDQVELEESVVESRLTMLREELDEIMPKISPRPDAPIPLRTAAE